MPILFYISSFIAIVATIMVITRYHPIHALLYLVISFLGVAMTFFAVGAPFVAILEIFLYAGAIIVLLIFVVMMLNLGVDTANQEKQWLQPKIWVGPSILALILLGELIVLLVRGSAVSMEVPAVEIKKISVSLYGEYVIAVELAGFLLMAGIVGAAHVGKHIKKLSHRFLEMESPSEAKTKEEKMKEAVNE
jgi:NADH-quinone oxidoreductase subunit J